MNDKETGAKKRKKVREQICQLHSKEDQEKIDKRMKQDKEHLSQVYSK